MKKIFLGFCLVSFFLGFPVSAGVCHSQGIKLKTFAILEDQYSGLPRNQIHKNKLRKAKKKCSRSSPFFNGLTQGCDVFMKPLLEVPIQGIQEFRGPVRSFVADKYRAVRQRSFKENVNALGDTLSALRKDSSFSFTLAAASVLGYVPPLWVEEREGAMPGTQMPESASAQAGNVEFKLHKVRELSCKPEDGSDPYIYLMSEYRIHGPSGINGVYTELQKKKKNEIDSDWKFAGGKMRGIPEKLLQNSNLKTREKMTWKEIGHSFVCSIFQQLYVDTEGKLRYFSWNNELQVVVQEIQRQGLPAYITTLGKAADESLITDALQIIGFGNHWARVSEGVGSLVYKIIDWKIDVSELITDLKADCREMHEAYQTWGFLTLLKQRRALIAEELNHWKSLLSNLPYNFLFNQEARQRFKDFGFGGYWRTPVVLGSGNFGFDITAHRTTAAKKKE